MRVYVDKLTPRVAYAINLVLRDTLLVEGIRITDKWEAFSEFEGPRLIYGRKKLEGVPSIFNVELLFEKDISEQDLNVHFEEDGLPYFFATSNQSFVPFDIFAASFYLVSRYEEYLPNISDVHDRYPHEESLAHQHGFLQKPVVNHWALQLKRKLLEADPRWEFEERTFKYTSTVDVDNLYAYKGKGGFRTLGGFAKDISQLDFKNAFRRARVLFGLKRDPYDTFEFQRDLAQQYGVSAIYFMLFSEFGEYDRNVPMYSRRLHEAVRAINDFFPVGIHPSYGSHASPKVLEREIKGLEDALRMPVKRSRQHFLKMKMPETFRQLLDFGIEEDYTMGYAGELGFRASICTPYRLYDLEMETELGLKMFPFAAMDGTLIYYKNVDAKDAFEYIQPLVDEVKAVNGHLITVWHNRIFSEAASEWRGWNDVYVKLLKYITK
ncbi:polysaccharide deacetylase family protein [Phaeocystidibacter luteus]|uniref:DUF7033 domain-containing protein n=1 Tax=Phaeocystidibacter luteus TaxID=911197 RepID=A0A6N6REI0_9FLAO|nr:polysaccharide deacetylase family protein [Phaeocystidibacter luteus]KAB2808061.1 hypothetical protein F8C67_10845 [Phaeocystidibacter luteus]